MFETLKKVESEISRQIAKATGAVVDVTYRSADKWTLSGIPEAAKAAADYMITNGLMAMEDSAYDEEIGESFFYMTSTKA